MEIFRLLNKEPFWSHHMLVLSLSVVFFLILKHFFKCGCFSRYHTYFSEKNEFDYLVQNLILNSLAQFFKPKFRKTKKLVRSFLFGLFHFRAILIKFGFLVFSDDLGHLGIPLRACRKQKNQLDLGKKSSSYLKRIRFQSRNSKNVISLYIYIDNQLEPDPYMDGADPSPPLFSQH